MNKHLTLLLSLFALKVMAQTPNTLVFPNPQPNPAPQSTNTYSRAAQTINLQPGFNFNPTSGFLNLNISSYPPYVNSNYQNPATTPGYFSANPSLEAAVTLGAQSVDAMGGFNYNIPIICSPGTAGIEPKLNISYSSNNDNGWLGLGFNLTGISMITRGGRDILNDGRKGGVDFTSKDVFILDGQRLLLKSGTYGQNGATYKTEIENYFTITSINSSGSGPQYFTVSTPEGLSMEYGKVASSRRTDRTGAEVLSWYITKVYDVFGNYMTYSYSNSDGELLIDRIDYTGNGSLNPYNKIEFSYVDRSDVNSYYMGGKEFTRKHILKTILCKDINGAIVRQYKLDYQYELASMLARITESDANGNTLNPTFIDWTKQHISSSVNSSLNVTRDDFITHVPEYKFFIPADLNGDGLSDILLLDDTQGLTFRTQITPMVSSLGTNPGTLYSGVVEYIASFVFDEDDDGIDEVFVAYSTPINSTDFQFHVDKIKKNSSGGYSVTGEISKPLPQNTKPSLWRLAERANSFSTASNASPYFYAKEDITGDGIKEIISCIHSKLEFLISDNFTTLTVNPYNVIKTTLADFDGDNVLDVFILRSGNSPGPPYICDVYKYNAVSAAMDLIATQNINIDVNPSIGSWNTYNNSSLLNEFANASKSIDFGDFNGDGKTDIVYMKYNQGSTPDGNIYILKSDGVTFLADNNPSLLPTHINGLEANYTAADINGDGYCDLLVQARDNTNGVSYYDHYPSNGNFLTTHWGTHSFNDLIVGAIGDFDGDNLLDHVSQGDFDGSQMTSNMFDQSNKRLLKKIYNIKDFTKVEYAFLPKRTPASVASIYPGDFYQKTSPINTDPAFKIITPKIFVVTHTDNNDRIFRYGYENAIFHEAGNGFLGFEKTYTADHNSVLNAYGDLATISTNLYSSSFDGIIESQTIETYAGVPVFYTLNKPVRAYNKVTLNYTQSGSNRYLNSTTSESKNYLSSTYSRQINTFDNTNGGLISSKTKSNLKWLTQVVINALKFEYTYQNFTNSFNGAVYYKVIQNKETRSAVNTSIYLNGFTYDSQGRLTSSVKNSNHTGLAVTTNFTQFNTFGQAIAISIIAPDLAQQKSSSLLYDVTGRFVLQTTDALGLTEYAQYEPKYGNIVQTTDALGLIEKYEYDGLGKIIKSTSSTGAINTIKYEWHSYTSPYNASPLFGIKVIKNYEANGMETVYYTNSNQELKTESSGFGGNTIVSESSYYVNNLLETKSEPHFANQSVYKYFNYKYDWAYRLDKVIENKNNGMTLKTVKYFYNNVSDNSNYNKGFIKIETPSGNGSGVHTTISENNEASQTDNIINYHNSSSQHSSSYLFNEHNQPTQMVTGFPGGQGGATTLFTYDLLGRQKTITDPSAGVVTTIYNSIGELVSSTKSGNQYIYAYDVAGRLTAKTGAGTEAYTYDYVTSGNGLTNLKKITGPNVVTEFKYDAFNRVIEKKETIGSKQFVSNLTYDKYGRLIDHVYPGSFKTTNEYETNGFLKRIKNNSTVIWELNTMVSPDLISGYYNSAGTLVQSTYDNNLNLSQKSLGNVSTQGFVIDPATLNILERTHLNSSTSTNNYEAFEFDNFDRLTKTKYLDVNNVLQTKHNFTYKANGNLDHKDDCGDYIYGTSAKPYQLTQIQNPTTDVSFNTLSVTHTAFDKVSQISESTSNKEYNFTHGNSEERFKMEYRLNSQLQYTRYYNENYDREETSNSYREWSYINSPSGLVAVYYNNNGNGQLLDITTDNLGSPVLLTNSSGAIQEEYSFDAWGRRRNPADWSYSNVSAPVKMIRGYTGHEHLDELHLINMNGRVYYPVLGRFIQPDPFVQNAANIQNFNRYSYVLNNPLKYVDPSGYKQIGRGGLSQIEPKQTILPPPPTIYLDGVRIEPGSAGYGGYITAASGNGGGGLGVGRISYIGVGYGTGPNKRGNIITSGAVLDYMNMYPGNVSSPLAQSGYIQLIPLGTYGMFVNPIDGRISTGNYFEAAIIQWTNFNSVSNGFLSDLGQVLNVGGVVWGGSELYGHYLRQNQGGQALGNFLGFGTQQTSKALTRTVDKLSKWGKGMGTVGMVLSSVGYVAQLSDPKSTTSTTTHVNFWVGTGLYGAAMLVGGPVVGGVALVYGALQLGSYLMTGNNLEENILGK